MNNDKLSLTSPPENHLSVDQIYRYLDNELPNTDRHQVEQHLLDCDLCSDALSGLSLTSREDTERQLLQMNYQLKNRGTRRKPNTILHNLKNWGLTTFILFIILMAALLVWYQVKQAASTQKPKAPTPVSQPVTSRSFSLKEIPLPDIIISIPAHYRI